MYPCPSVGVVIVNWNCWRDTLAAAQSVRDHAAVVASAIVVDNASGDGSVARLSAAGVEVLDQEANLGFAAACNIGARSAFARGADYVLFLNPDAVVIAGTIQALIAAADSPSNPVALGSLIRYKDDGKFQFVGSRPGRFTGLPIWIDPVVEPEAIAATTYVTDYIMGAALFITRAAFEKAGPLPEHYFLYYEETAWCYAARLAGVSCKMVSSSIVVHEGSGTVGSSMGPLQSYFVSRNELLFLRTFGTRRQRLGRTWYYTFWLAKLLLKAAVRRRLSLRGRAIALGLRDYLLGRFGDCPPAVRCYAITYKNEGAL